MADHALAQAAIDGAFAEHMKGLFGGMVRHVERGDVEGGRKEFRKALGHARQAHSEMVAIAQG